MNRWSCRALVQNGGIYVDFHDGSGDDNFYEDVYNGFEYSGGESCVFCHSHTVTQVQLYLATKILMLS